VLTWSERGGPKINREPEGEGFGSVLARGATSQLGGQISRSWRPEGLIIRLTVPLERLLA
jgi:two-component sensor histidine kinase